MIIIITKKIHAMYTSRVLNLLLNKTVVLILLSINVVERHRNMIIFSVTTIQIGILQTLLWCFFPELEIYEKSFQYMNFLLAQFVNLKKSACKQMMHNVTMVCSNDAKNLLSHRKQPKIEYHLNRYLY